MTTDDELEALATLLLRHGHVEWTERDGYVVADAILAAGFTRSRPATEPSEGEVEAAVAVLRAAPAVSTATVRAALRAARGVGK